MRVLIADDDVGIRRGLTAQIRADGFDVVACATAGEAIKELKSEQAPQIALIDWILPDETGLEICRAVGGLDIPITPYMIMLTVKKSASDIAQALDAGAHDYVTKPFSMMELRARIRVGRRMAELQAEVRHQEAKAQNALREVRQLTGLLPICGHCRKLRDDESYRQELEDYLNSHTATPLARGVCPACAAQTEDGDRGVELSEDSAGG